jgi:hypothetical protein
LFTERLNKRGCNNVALGLSGLTIVSDRLRESHESAPRLFQFLTLLPLQPDERIDVVRKGLAEIKRKVDIDVTITPEAESYIASMSEGFPHFIQQFAYSAVEFDQDNHIDKDDVEGGAFGKNGALAQLGQKYFHDLYFEQVGSDEYRSILRYMAEGVTADSQPKWCSKDELRKATKLKETTLGNAISALKQRNIILAQDGVKGVYRLPTNSFAAWIRMFTHVADTNGELFKEALSTGG